MKETELQQCDLEEAVYIILEVAQNASNEEQMKIAIENQLRVLCEKAGFLWNPYTYEHGFKADRRRLDAVHGATIIEYEFPRSFDKRENSAFSHAKKQAEEYTALLAKEEGRDGSAYSLVVWDGESIAFATCAAGLFWWEPIRQFDHLSLARLVSLIGQGGKPLVNPKILKQFVGPDTRAGRDLLPKFFNSIVAAKEDPDPTRTKLIFCEWARLFGQVDGDNSERLSTYLAQVSINHGIDYTKDPQAYVFALNTYIAIIAKVCAAYALASSAQTAITADSSPSDFLNSLEQGTFFKEFGVENMISTDFFSWYLGEDVKEDLTLSLAFLMQRLNMIDFDTSRKSAESIRDLFKGLYMEFMPAAMRHALGEYYTPDWLASHVIDVVGWDIDESFLDPTCGSGTFVLEAVRRRLEQAHPKNTAAEILDGIYGCDLNPLAVLTARASLVVSLAERFDADRNVVLPIFLADAINTADPHEGVFSHTILTEKGARSFAIPEELANASDFYGVMDHLRVCVDADLSEEQVFASLESFSDSVSVLDIEMKRVFHETICNLIDLHKNHWNGIWCLILFDRIKAGCIRNVQCVAGNPPWVKWSHLPRQYAEFIKPLCERMDIFSDDVWVGGIQSDISTVITYHALERFVSPGGSLAFLITGTVLKNESSQGFRRWELQLQEDAVEPMSVCEVEDYKDLKPFDDVANWPVLLVIKRNGIPTSYPVRYRCYEGPSCKVREHFDPLAFIDKYATPIPGTIDGPWVVGSRRDIDTLPVFFDVSGSADYRARKGVTTDANGIYFVDVCSTRDRGLVKVANDPLLGRRKDVKKKRCTVESKRVYPLLRGRDVVRFRATPESRQGIIVPQDSMFGDEDLPSTNPRLFRYLSSFRDVLASRSSYRRFQRGKPYWSVWSVGDYTFSPYKVVWREMYGGAFCTAYISSAEIGGEKKVVVPDHKLYFIPLEDEEEAAYLSCYLNSSLVSGAVNAYASTLSLGTSIVDYLYIPKYDPQNEQMRELADLGKRFHYGEDPSISEEEHIDMLVWQIVSARNL